MMTPSRIPCLISLFVAQSLMILSKPESHLYPQINRFLLQRPCLDLGDIPLFYNFLYSGSLHFKQERHWMLNLLTEGLVDSTDWNLYCRRHVLELTWSLGKSCCSERNSMEGLGNSNSDYKKILQLFEISIGMGGNWIGLSDPSLSLLSTIASSLLTSHDPLLSKEDQEKRHLKNLWKAEVFFQLLTRELEGWRRMMTLPKNKFAWTSIKERLLQFLPLLLKQFPSLVPSFEFLTLLEIVTLHQTRLSDVILQSRIRCGLIE